MSRSFFGLPELMGDEGTLPNPVAILGVLSASTRSYDRGDKFSRYRSIPTLRDYALVDAEHVFVEHVRRIADGAEYRDQKEPTREPSSKLV